MPDPLHGVACCDHSPLCRAGLYGHFKGYGNYKYAEYDPYGKQSNFTSVYVQSGGVFSINRYLLKLESGFVVIVYIACAPPQNPFLSQPLDTRTTRESSFKDLTGSPHRGCV